MSSSLIINESLMIKDRLREAYNTILLISDNDFAQDQNYKRSHQVLHARIKKLEDDDQFEGHKFVGDVIPNSNLAKYGRYQYNETRERTYTPCAHESTFHYPYQCKCELAREPWMLPEVEQVFIHTIYASSYNFNLYETELEKLDKLDAFGDENAFHGLFPFNCMGEFNKTTASSISREQLFEKTPGGKQSTSNNQPSSEEPELKVTQDLPYYFNVTEIEGVMLRKRIQSDDVRNLWEKPKLGSKDRLLEVYKSLLDNIFFHEDEYCHVNSLKSDDTNLQKLVSSIISLNQKVPKSADIQSLDSKSTECTINSESIPTPQRRLYSDVVQGNRHSQIKCARLQEVASPKSDCFSDETSNVNKTSSVFLHSETTNSSTAFIDPLHIDAPSPSSSTMDTSIQQAESISPNTTISHSPASTKSSTTNRFSYSDAVNNNHCGYPINQFNMPFMNDVSMYDNSIRSNTSSTAANFQNVFNPMQFISNAMFTNTNYRLGYPNTGPTTYPATTYASQHQHINRQQNMNPNSCQQHPSWFVTPYRPTPYSVLLLPQLPTKHRWPNQHYIRPTTPQSMYNPGTSQNQVWQSQSLNINRSNSNQHVNCYSLYDAPQKGKKKPLTAANSKFARSKTTDSVSLSKSKNFGKKPSATTTVAAAASSSATAASYPNKILTKPNSDYRIMTRQDNNESSSATSSNAVEGKSSSSRASDTDPLIPISCCASDELEKIALREYQSSNDMFFNEIERQAEEQYDGNPENFCRPPNRKQHVFIGGLPHHATIYFIFHLYLSINTC